MRSVATQTSLRSMVDQFKRLTARVLPNGFGNIGNGVVLLIAIDTVGSLISTGFFKAGEVEWVNEPIVDVSWGSAGVPAQGS